MVGWCRCVVHRGSIDRSSVDLLGFSWVATSWGRRVNGLARVGHVSHKAIGMIGSVGDSLNSAVRKRNGVRTVDNTAGVLGLGSLEVGLGVVVRDAIREGVGHMGLLGIFHRGRSIIDNWCWSMVDNWGRRMIDSRGRSVVGNRCGMDKSMMAMADAVPVVNSVSNVGDVRHCGLKPKQIKKQRIDTKIFLGVDLPSLLLSVRGRRN